MNNEITKMKVERVFNDSLNFEEIITELFEAMIDKEYNKSKDLPLTDMEVAE